MSDPYRQAATIEPEPIPRVYYDGLPYPLRLAWLEDHDQCSPVHLVPSVELRSAAPMSDDNKSLSADRKLIAMSQEHEVRYWTGKFGVSKEKLQEAVDAVGNSAAKVQEWLASR